MALNDIIVEYTILYNTEKQEFGGQFCVADYLYFRRLKLCI